MSGPIVTTLRTYWNPVEAGLAKSLLDEEGIFCTLADENANSYGGAPSAMPIRLQVEEERAEDALRILNAEFAPVPDDAQFPESSPPTASASSKTIDLPGEARKRHSITGYPMKPRDWFILIIRAFGIWEAIITLDYAVGLFNVHANLTRLERTQPEAYVTHGLLSLLLAGWFLSAAPAISRFFYPDTPEKPEADPPTTKVEPDEIL